MYKCRPLSRQGGIVYLHVQNVRANAWQPCMEPLFPHVKFPVVGNISWAGHCFETTFAAPMCSALLRALLHTDHSATACLKHGETQQLPLSIERWKIIRCIYSVKVHSAVLKQSGHTFLCLTISSLCSLIPLAVVKTLHWLSEVYFYFSILSTVKWLLLTFHYRGKYSSMWCLIKTL